MIGSIVLGTLTGLLSALTLLISGGTVLQASAVYTLGGLLVTAASLVLIFCRETGSSKEQQFRKATDACDEVLARGG